MELYNEALANDGLAPKYPQSAIDGSNSGSDPVQFPNEDYFNSTYLRNFSNYYNLVGEASGGNDIAQYYLNVGINRTTGLLNIGEGRNEKKDRINVRGNVDYKLNDVIKIRFDGAVIFNMTKAPRYTSGSTNFWSLASTLYPNTAPVLIPADLMEDTKLLGAANLVDNKYLLGGTSEYQTNMYGELTMNGPEETNERLLEMNVGLNFNLNKLTPGLTADLFFTYDLQNVFRTDIMNSYAVYSPTYTNGAISSWSKNNLDAKVNTLTLADVIFSRRNGLYGKIDYHKSFGYHEITANALGYFDQYTFEGILQPTKHLNFGGRVNYSYKQKMIAEFTGVVSGSTKLSETTPWGFQPGFGLGWIMTKENFLADKPNINYLKLRGNIALTKNDEALNNYFPGHDFYMQSSSYPYNHGTGSNYSFLLTRGNPNLGFEKRLNANLGFDALLLQDKLSLEASWFYYKTYDAFSQRTNYLPAYFGSLYWQNYGSYDTKGAEMGATYTLTAGDMTIKLGSNLVYSLPKKLVVDELNYKEDYHKAAGKAADAMFGYVSMGLFQDQADIDNSPTQLFGTVKPGDIKYQDLNSDGQIDELDQKMIGNSHPRIDYSFNVSVTYKAFELFVLATGQGGYNTIFNSPYYWVYGNRKYSEAVLNRWSPSGAETNSLATYPRLSTLSSENNFRNSTYWLYKSNWFTLQTAQLTYSLPAKIGGIKEARFFVRGNNLMTMSKIKDKMQLNIGTAPQTRFYSLGISVTL
jgi:TonB-linked SusC/RagA family outer membrane protein